MTQQPEHQNMTFSGRAAWWGVVQAVAELVARSGMDPLEEGLLRVELERLGFGAEEIKSGFAWLDQAGLSGSLVEILCMLGPRPTGLRVENPYERVFVSDKVWQEFDKIRRTEIVGSDTTERILEGMRVLDTRDWEDDEVRHFIGDVLAASGQDAESERFEQLLNGRTRDFYN